MRIPTMRLGVILRAGAVWLASMLAPRDAHAGGIASCAEPFAFANADVNVVVLPYFPSAQGRPLGGLGGQLALLVKLETLYGSLSYNRWGVTLLTGPRELCDPKRVTDILVARKLARPGSRLIIVFGNLYQRDDDIYVQTYTRAYRVPTAAGRVAGPDVMVQVGSSRFNGRVNVDELAFPPELLSAAFIRRVADSFTKAMFVYAAPRLTASKERLPLLDEINRCEDCHAGLAFRVVARRGDWIQITMADDRTGYLYARQDSIGLADRLPELSFIHGLMGFLRYNAVGQDNTTASGVRTAAQSFMRYAAREQEASEPETRAVALQLAGILDFTFSKIDPSGRMDEAYRLVPFSAEARNLAAMFRLARAYGDTGRSVRPRAIANDFLASAALDPTNAMVLANVQSVYELMAAPATAAKVDTAAAIPPAEVRAQLAKVRAIRASPARAGP
jgi:hypothetical protein